MKAIICSDAHLDARCCGIERFDEVSGAFVEAREHAIETRRGTGEPVLFVFCGDLCDPDDGRDVLRATSFAIEQSRVLGEAGVDQLWVCGNHDVGGDGSTVLDPLDAARYGRVAARAPLTFEVPMTRDSGREFVHVLALPYSPVPYDAEEALVSFLLETNGEPHRLVFTHLQLPGMHPGSESLEMARGRERAFPVARLRGEKRLTVVAGHYHAGQRTQDGILVVGAMARNTFAEETNIPGMLVIDVQRQGVEVSRVPFSSARAMVTLGAEHPIWRDVMAVQGIEGAFVRVAPGENEPEDAVARVVGLVRQNGALAVKVLGTRRDAVLVRESERSEPERRSLREVVLAMTTEAISRDRGALRGFVEEIADEAGL